MYIPLKIASINNQIEFQRKLCEMGLLALRRSWNFIHRKAVQFSWQSTGLESGGSASLIPAPSLAAKVTAGKSLRLENKDLVGLGSSTLSVLKLSNSRQEVFDHSHQKKACVWKQAFPKIDIQSFFKIWIKEENIVFFKCTTLFPQLIKMWLCRHSDAIAFVHSTQGGWL